MFVYSNHYVHLNIQKSKYISVYRTGRHGHVIHIRIKFKKLWAFLYNVKTFSEFKYGSIKNNLYNKHTFFYFIDKTQIVVRLVFLVIKKKDQLKRCDPCRMDDILNMAHPLHALILFYSTSIINIEYLFLTRVRTFLLYLL